MFRDDPSQHDEAWQMKTNSKNDAFTMSKMSCKAGQMIDEVQRTSYIVKIFLYRLSSCFPAEKFYHLVE